MTREEKIVILKDIIDGEIIHPQVRKDVGEWAIKVLKQEPILDKIRAEIEQAADKQFQIAMGVTDLNERYTHIQMENVYRHSLNIIDKYRGESENKYGRYRISN